MRLTSTDITFRESVTKPKFRTIAPLVALGALSACSLVKPSLNAGSALSQTDKPTSIVVSGPIVEASRLDRKYYTVSDQAEFKEYQLRIGKTVTKIRAEDLDNSISTLHNFARKIASAIQGVTSSSFAAVEHALITEGEFTFEGVDARRHGIEGIDAVGYLLDGKISINDAGMIEVHEYHPFSTVAAILSAGVSLDQSFTIEGKEITLNEIINAQVSEAIPRDETGWLLVALSAQLDGASLAENPSIKRLIEDGLYANFISGYRDDGRWKVGSCYDAHLTEGLIAAVTNFSGAEIYLPFVRKLMRKHLEHMVHKVYSEETGLQPTDYLRVIGHVIGVYGNAVKHGIRMDEDEQNMLRYAVSKMIELTREIPYYDVRVLTYTTHLLDGMIALKNSGQLS